MQITIELDEKTIAEIDAAARNFNKDRLQYINDSLRKILRQDRGNLSNTEKVKKFAESYEKFPQDLDEYEVWQDEQVWENE